MRTLLLVVMTMMVGCAHGGTRPSAGDVVRIGSDVLQCVGDVYRVIRQAIDQNTCRVISDREPVPVSVQPSPQQP